MSKASKFAAVNAKIRAMESKFLKDDDYINLLHKKNIPEAFIYLKQETHYHDILEMLSENDIHRVHLENLIRKYHTKQIEKILHYFFDDYRKFYRYILIKREIEELKTILRNIKADARVNFDEDAFVHIGMFSKLNPDTLLSSNTLGDFIGNLKGTIYYKYLQPLEDERVHGTLFMGEMALDLAYFDVFYDLINGISKEDRDIVRNLQGTNVDLLNIQWIYRGIKFYDLPREILFNYTIPYGWEFTRKELKELCYVNDSGELQNRVLRTKYRFLFDNENNKDILMERRALRYQYYIFKDLRKGFKMNISQAIAFDVLLEYEIRDIVTIIESTLYDMPEDDAKKYLIRKL